VTTISAEPAAGISARRAPVPTTGAPLVAVAALCSGAGATTFALLAGLAAARRTSRPVLVCDTGGPSGGLAAYAGTETPYSLTEASRRIAAGLPVRRDELSATTAEGLRIIAAGPRLDDEGPAEAIQRILGDARLAHGASFVDCGALARPAARTAIAMASHVVWVLPATVSGVRRARAALQVLTHSTPGQEILVARHDSGDRPAPLPALTELAARRGASLLLMPHVPDLAQAPATDALEAAEVALEAVRMVLRR
jgi:MinD-like ATPase involved in chromosome partitioning or flagellar assembly